MCALTREHRNPPCMSRRITEMFDSHLPAAP